MSQPKDEPAGKNTQPNIHIPTPSEGTEDVKTLMERGDALCLQFERLGITRDIDEAIECHSRAVSLTPDGHINKTTCLNNLGNSYTRRFDRSGNPDDIDKAIDCHTQAVSLTADGKEVKPRYLNNLGGSYLSRFEHMGDIRDIDNAIDCQMQVVSLTPDGHVNKPGRLNNLGSLYQTRFECLGDYDDINRAIDSQVQAVALIPDGDANKPACLNNLGNSYVSRFEHLGDLADISKGIDYQVQAVALTPDGYADKPGFLNNLGDSYQCRFSFLGDLTDINTAIDYQRLAVQLTPDGHANKPRRLNNLGASHWRRFDHLQDIADLNEAIDCQSQAVSLAPDGHPEKLGYLNNLGVSHSARFQNSGDLADINEAIECQLQVALLTPDGFASKPTRLNSLGLSYQRRFDHLNDPEDINKAIDFQVQAVSLIPDGHPSKPGMLTNLASSYLSRFDDRNELEDVDKSIEHQLQALSLIPDEHTVKSGILNNLGNSFMSRFDYKREAEDINRAIEYRAQAMSLTPSGHAAQPGYLVNLGRSYHSRFEEQGDIEDINKAIDYQTQGLSLTPDGHADKAAMLTGLGRSYELRFTHLADAQDVEKAIKCFRQAAEFATGSVVIRFGAARMWAKVSSQHNLPCHLDAYHRVIELLPQLVWLGETVARRYRHITDIGDVASQAAAHAIKLGVYDRALEWLEQARSIVWSQLLQLRTPVDDLSAQNPTLAKRLKQVSHELEHAGSRVAAAPVSLAHQSDLEKSTKHQHELASEWNQLLQEARTIPGFEDFMRPQKATSLIRAAKRGPVVVINIHNDCDALIIQQDSEEIAHIPLPNFSMEKARDVRTGLGPLIGRQGTEPDTRHIKCRQPQPDDSYTNILADLWTDVVKPVLDFLGYTNQKSVEELPHITWCSAGIFSFLPLHAAGLYDGSQLNVFDFVVSSYTPTLSALLGLNSQLPAPHSGILAVGQENTKGLARLPCTRLELATVKEHAKSVPYLQLEDGDATVEAVLNAMDAHSWVHLACHATQEADDPSQSSFHLHDGILTLSAIMKRSFKGKGLAFLSACQTATGSKLLPDEAVHLAAGMLMAGYPSVIATMWAIQDEDAPEIARDVYVDLLKDGRMDSSGVSRALHKAVGHLREKVGASSFERWVPFIHIGE